MEAVSKQHYQWQFNKTTPETKPKDFIQNWSYGEDVVMAAYPYRVVPGRQDLFVHDLRASQLSEKPALTGDTKVTFLGKQTDGYVVLIDESYTLELPTTPFSLISEFVEVTVDVQVGWMYGVVQGQAPSDHAWTLTVDVGDVLSSVVAKATYTSIYGNMVRSFFKCCGIFKSLGKFKVSIHWSGVKNDDAAITWYTLLNPRIAIHQMYNTYSLTVGSSEDSVPLNPNPMSDEASFELS